MRDRSREMWYRDYMSIMDEEYDDPGITDGEVVSYNVECDSDENYYPIPEYDESTEGFGFGSVWPDDLNDESYHKKQKPKDDSVSTLPGFIKLRDIELPDKSTEKVKKLKRDLRMEALRRIENAARTVADFNVVTDWYDKLEANERSRVNKHELYRSGDDLPIEYGADENGAIFPTYMGNVISRQIRKGDFLDAIYCKPDTVDQLVTTDYLIHFMRALDNEDRTLFYFKVLERLSSPEIAEMRNQTDRAIRKNWKNLLFHLRQKAMGVLIFRSDKDYNFSGYEQIFLENCRDEYEYKIDPEANS